MYVEKCPFCAIASGKESAALVFEQPAILAFLDKRPLFHGHVLVVPREHIENLDSISEPIFAALCSAARAVSRAIERALEADGTFIAINNKVSQSVPHLHIHVVPRRKKDGLRGFFWPRTKYESDEDAADIARRIQNHIGDLSAAL